MYSPTWANEGMRDDRGLIKLIQRLLVNTLIHTPEPETIGSVPKQHAESSLSLKNKQKNKKTKTLSDQTD